MRLIGIMVLLVFALVSMAVVAGCSRDEKKYAKVVCEEMQDPEVYCRRGQRGTDTLARGFVATQIAECNMKIVGDTIANIGIVAPEEGWLQRLTRMISHRAFRSTCETTATKFGLSNEKFFTLDREMIARCQRGEESACLKACCGEDRMVQVNPALPSIMRRANTMMSR